MAGIKFHFLALDCMALLSGTLWFKKYPENILPLATRNAAYDLNAVYILGSLVMVTIYTINWQR